MYAEEYAARHAIICFQIYSDSVASDQPELHDRPILELHCPLMSNYDRI